MPKSQLKHATPGVYHVDGDSYVIVNDAGNAMILQALTTGSTDKAAMAHVMPQRELHQQLQGSYCEEDPARAILKRMLQMAEKGLLFLDALESGEVATTATPVRLPYAE